MRKTLSSQWTQTPTSLEAVVTLWSQGDFPGHAEGAEPTPGPGLPGVPARLWPGPCPRGPARATPAAVVTGTLQHVLKPPRTSLLLGKAQEEVPRDGRPRRSQLLSGSARPHRPTHHHTLRFQFGDTPICSGIIFTFKVWLQENVLPLNVW